MNKIYFQNNELDTDKYRSLVSSIYTFQIPPIFMLFSIHPTCYTSGLGR